MLLKCNWELRSVPVCGNDTMDYGIVNMIYRTDFRKSSSPEISFVLIIQFSYPITLKSCIKQGLWPKSTEYVLGKRDFVKHAFRMDISYSNSPLDKIQCRKQITRILPTANMFVNYVVGFVFKTSFRNYERANDKNLQHFLAVRYRFFACHHIYHIQHRHNLDIKCDTLRVSAMVHICKIRPLPWGMLQ